jgi:hypothetical protein
LGEHAACIFKVKKGEVAGRTGCTIVCMEEQVRWQSQQASGKGVGRWTKKIFPQGYTTVAL